MTEQLTPCDSADDLDTPAAIAEYLTVAAADHDAARLAAALAVAARAHARLHPTAPLLPPLADDPDLSALLDRLQALDLRLTFTPR